MSFSPIHRLIFTVLALLTGSMASAQTDEDIKRLYDARDAAKLEEFARAGNVKAQMWLGFMFQGGRRHAEGVFWSVRAGRGGEIWAMRLVADAYKRGSLDVPRNEAKAAYWMRRMAERGDSMAQIEIADALLKGAGVAKNEQEAFFWLSEAVKQEDEWAYLPLAELYANGLGVERDPIVAYALVLIAEYEAERRVFGLTSDIEKLKSKLWYEMSYRQVNEAYRHAKDIRPDIIYSKFLRGIIDFFLTICFVIVFLIDALFRSIFK